MQRLSIQDLCLIVIDLIERRRAESERQATERVLNPAGSIKRQERVAEDRVPLFSFGVKTMDVTSGAAARMAAVSSALRGSCLQFALMQTSVSPLTAPRRM